MRNIQFCKQGARVNHLRGRLSFTIRALMLAWKLNRKLPAAHGAGGEVRVAGKSESDETRVF
jgi:hypothetical protein